MNKKDLDYEYNLSYLDLTEYLKKKYGKVPYDYFTNERCAFKNVKNGRGNEGLFIHHIDENKVIMLSNKDYAPYYPFAYQKSDRLVYCNYIEHLILHIKIALEYGMYCIKDGVLLGYGGAVNFIIPEINDYFNGCHFKQEWKKKAYKLIENNFSDYIKIVYEFVLEFNKKAKEINCDSNYLLHLKDISQGRGYFISLNNKVYKKIKSYEAKNK